MKKIILSVFAVVCIFALFGCNKNSPDYASEHEAASSDFEKVNELAKSQFAEIFKEFDDLKIERTAIIPRSDDGKEVVVQFKYSSSDDNGVYGFLYNLDDFANPELIRHGKGLLNYNPFA